MTRTPKTRDDGEGSVYEEGGEGTGKWRAALVIDGKLERRRAKTEREAKRKLKELVAMREARLNVGDGKQTLETWANFWLTTILPGKRAKLKTIESYADVCRFYIVPHLGRYQLIRLTAQHIDEWMGALREKGLSDGTIGSARRKASALLEAARKRKLIPENPVSLTDAPPSAPKRKVPGEDVLEEAQVIRLLAELADHRLYALFVLAATLGLRQAELFGLRWPAIDLADGTLVVREQLQRIKDKDGHRRLHRERSTKGGKDRTLHLTAEQVAILTAHRARQRQERVILGDVWHGEDLVFTSQHGGALGETNTRDTLLRALARADLPAVTLHSLRHSAGSIMLAHGATLVAVSHVLGHSSPAITARIYAHAFEDGRREAAAAAANALLRSA